MKPLDKTMSLPAQTFFERIQYCRKMLVIHGFLSDAENEKAHKRIAKWVKENTAEPKK
jgi:hypothetical protein